MQMIAIDFYKIERRYMQFGKPRFDRNKTSHFGRLVDVHFRPLYSSVVGRKSQVQAQVTRKSMKEIVVIFLEGNECSSPLLAAFL